MPPLGEIVGHDLIAILEDDSDLGEALEELLQDSGYRTVRYANGAEALKALPLGELPAVIILDLMMPEMDGWTFRVRQRAHSRLRDIPVIVVTADPSPQAEAIDAVAYFSKPFDRAALSMAIESVRLAAERKEVFARSMELERVRALGMLLASVAHEVNNPLASVIGNLELAQVHCQRQRAVLDSTEQTAALPGLIDNALEAGQHVAQVAKNLLTFGHVETDSREADLERALAAAVQLSQPQVRSKATLIKGWTDLPRVVGNEPRLAQVFLNLLINAAQAIERGTPATNHVRIGVRVSEARIFVDIEDTGTGIAPQHLERIFEPFFTTKAPGQGTGIGLSFCKTTVESFGGTISVRSVLGEGTTFSVALVPLSEAHTATGLAGWNGDDP